MALVEAMGGSQQPQEVVGPVCRAAMERLEGRLRPGVAPEDCAELFPLAAACLARSELCELEGSADISQVSAGDLTIHRSGSNQGDRLRVQAMRLMQPYVTEEGFCAMGVRG